MAVVASPTNHVPSFSPNFYEWPPINEEYNESTTREPTPVRGVISGLANSQCGETVLSLQTYISTNAELQNSCSEIARDDAQNVNPEINETIAVSLVGKTNSISTLEEPAYTIADSENVANESHVPESTEIPAQLECSSAASDRLDDASVLYGRSDVEVNSCSPKPKAGENIRNTHSKKKKRLKKARRKSLRKWKPYHSDELGFYISLTTYFVDETANIEEDTIDEDNATNVVRVENELYDKDICQDCVTQAEPMETANVNKDSCQDCVTQTKQVAMARVNEDLCECEESQVEPLEVISLDASSDSTVQDDIDFFLDLGIDVVNYDNQDSVQNWDGVYVSAPSTYCSCYELDNKQPSRPKNNSTKRTATDSQANKSQKETHKTVGQSGPETTHTFPAQHFDFTKIKKSDKYKLFELECSSTKRIYIRRDRHRKKEKAHKAVKSKNCCHVLNNIGRKRMYIHHRLIKMHSLDLDFRGSVKSCRIPAMPKTKIAADVAKVVFRADRKIPVVDQSVPPVQSLHHALHETNVAGIEGELANFLITLQHRDLTPEDYDMLLRLDDSVKPKTISKKVLDRLRTEKIGPNGPEQGANDWEPLCTICMEPYVTGQERKFLPCSHDFHTDCIDKWLKNSSMNCPLDGLPVDAS